MKTRYTNIVLSIIALCLIWISVRDFVITRRIDPKDAHNLQEAGLFGIGTPDRASAINAGIQKVLLVDNNGKSIVWTSEGTDVGAVHVMGSR